MTFPPVTLRPRDHGVALDDVVLIVKEDPGSIITGTCSATALKAEGVSEGSFRLVVSGDSLPVGELLASNESDDSDGIASEAHIDLKLGELANAALAFSARSASS